MSGSSRALKGLRSFPIEFGVFDYIGVHLTSTGKIFRVSADMSHSDPGESDGPEGVRPGVTTDSGTFGQAFKLIRQDAKPCALEARAPLSHRVLSAGIGVNLRFIS